MLKETRLEAWISGVGLLGPGLPNWPEGRHILGGKRAYQPAATCLSAPDLLPPAERRRSSAPIKLAMTIGKEATDAAGLQAKDLAGVFCTSSGDGHNCHAICETLASDDCRISPTRFHNSVNNAAPGYWSIATHSMHASTLLCAYDASFSAGLLEAVTQVAVEGNSILLVTYDTDYPEPLNALRPIPDSMGIALILSGAPQANSLASVLIQLTDAEPTALAHPELESLRLQVPAARGLPLLEALATGQSGRIVLDYLEPLRLCIDVTPC